METKTIITENWFTRAANPNALLGTLLLAVLLYGGCYLYFYDVWEAASWMSANRAQVFEQHQWWRAWTTLIAHGDLAHLLANSFLFFLFAYTLMSYFSWWFFPVAGFFMGGLVNLVVLATMDPHVNLVGASGVVHWMGAAWTTLYLLLENRQSFRSRFGSGLFLMLMLFTPDTYKPNVSYMAHFVGFVFGVSGAYLYYVLNRREFDRSVRRETIIIPEWEFGPWDGSDDHLTEEEKLLG